MTSDHPRDPFGDPTFAEFFDGSGPVPDDLRRVVEALQAPGAPDLATRHAVVARMADALDTQSSLQSERGNPVFRRFSRRSAVLIAAGTLAFGSVAAAAGGGGVLSEVFGGGSHEDDGVDVIAADETTTSPTADSEPTPNSVDDSTTTTSVDETTSTTMSQDECGDVENHGDFVSDAAHDKDHEGSHGSHVSEAAKSDCGKNGDDTDGADDTDGDDADSGVGDDTGTSDGDAPGNSDDHRNDDNANGNGNGNGNGNRP